MTSRPTKAARDNTSEAYLLFGDRIDGSDLEVTAMGEGSFAPGAPGFFWLSAYCSRVHVELLLA